MKNKRAKIREKTLSRVSCRNALRKSMPIQNFYEFHQLIGEAMQTMENIPISEDDKDLLAKRLHVLQALVDAQKQALQLETMFKSVRTIPRNE